MWRCGFRQFSTTAYRPVCKHGSMIWANFRYHTILSIITQTDGSLYVGRVISGINDCVSARVYTYPLSKRQEAFEKCWAHSPLRAAVTLPFTRCRYCRTPAMAIAQAACDVHDDDDNDNAWQRGPLWPHGMGPKNDWAINTELDTVHDSRIKPGVKRSKFKVVRLSGALPAWVCRSTQLKFIFYKDDITWSFKTRYNRGSQAQEAFMAPRQYVHV